MLPQILKKSGIDNYLFQRPAPHEKGDMPESLFKWEAPDGSSVNTFRIIGAYGMESGMEKLRRLGFKTAAMALRDDSVSIDDPKLLAEEKLAIILGSEGDGLTNDTIADCDYTVKIPMYHDVDSLNVAAASAVAFWQLRSRT